MPHPSLIAETLDRLRPFRHTAIVFVERAVLVGAVQSASYRRCDSVRRACGMTEVVNPTELDTI